MNIAILLAFGAMVFWGVGDFLIQRCVRLVGSLETLFWINLASSVILFPFVYKSLPDLNGYQFLILLFLGLIGFLGAYIHFEALDVGKLSVVEVIFSLELPLTIILGVVILHEALTIEIVLLMLLLFSGIILLSVDFKKINTREFLEKGALLAIISAVLVASINFLTAVGAKEINPILVIWFPWLMVGLMTFIYLLVKKRWKNIVHRSRPFWKILVIMIIIDIAAWLFYAFALSQKELSITTAITESFVVIAMILGIVFNKERVRPIQYAGAALAVVSSILIGIFS